MDAKVIVYPNDMTGSGVYRMQYPAKAVADTGKPVISMPKPPQIVIDDNGTVRGISVGSYNTVVFQRPGSYQFTQVIPLLQAQGIKVIVDMDDSLSTIHPRNVAFKSYDPRVSHKMNWMHAARSCELADLVTVTTPALLEEYGNGHGIVIPNHIPESYLKIQRPVNEVPIVTWAGWVDTHPEDLLVTRGMVNTAIVDTGAVFAAFGDKNIFRDLQIRNRPPNQHWGFVGINQYANQLIKADIGLVPLKDTPFNRCKSALKILEYSSLGVVSVASPTPDNMRLIEQGMGIAASTPKEWYDRVRELIEDDEYRLEMSQTVRRLAANHTIEGNVHLWWTAWSN